MDRQTQRLYELKAEVVQSVAHPIRLAIVDFLSGGEQCVCDISTHVGAQRSNVSRHLAVMLNAGVVECRKEGLKVIYSLKTPCVLKFLDCVTDVLRDQARQSQSVLSRL